MKKQIERQHCSERLADQSEGKADPVKKLSPQGRTENLAEGRKQSRQEMLEVKKAWQRNNKERVRAWYHRTKYLRREKIKEYGRRTYWKNRDKIIAKNRAWVRNNYAWTLEYRRTLYLRKKFGMSDNEYELLLKSQGGVCAICHSLCKFGRRLAIDHCHKTNKIRGLLCGRCNLGIGRFEDSVEILKNAISYLSK